MDWRQKNIYFPYNILKTINCRSIITLDSSLCLIDTEGDVFYSIQIEKNNERNFNEIFIKEILFSYKKYKDFEIIDFDCTESELIIKGLRSGNEFGKEEREVIISYIIGEENPKAGISDLDYNGNKGKSGLAFLNKKKDFEYMNFYELSNNYEYNNPYELSNNYEYNNPYEQCKIL